MDQRELGFALSAAGEAIYLIHSNGMRVIDAVRFGGQASGVAYGRSPDGADTAGRCGDTTRSGAAGERGGSDSARPPAVRVVAGRGSSPSNVACAAGAVGDEAPPP